MINNYKIVKAKTGVTEYRIDDQMLSDLSKLLFYPWIYTLGNLKWHKIKLYKDYGKLEPKK